MGIEPFLAASSIDAILAQRLVRVICPHCKEPYKPPEKVLAQWGLDGEDGANLQRGRGCFNCMGTGYKGRTGIFEVLVIDEMIQDLILKNKSAQEISRAAQQAGRLRSLKEHAIDKVLEGETTLEEAASAVMA